MNRLVAATRVVRAASVARVARPAAALQPRRAYSGPEELSDADFDAKWKAFFADPSHDARTVRRGLNDVFAYDVIPDPSILEEALRALRRVDDFASSVRVFEGIKDKSPDEVTYIHVVNALQPVIEELQLTKPEELDLQ